MVSHLAAGDAAIDRTGANLPNQHSSHALVCIRLRFLKKKGCALDAENASEELSSHRALSVVNTTTRLLLFSFETFIYTSYFKAQDKPPTCTHRVRIHSSQFPSTGVAPRGTVPVPFPQRSWSLRTNWTRALRTARGLHRQGRDFLPPHAAASCPSGRVSPGGVPRLWKEPSLPFPPSARRLGTCS